MNTWWVIGVWLALWALPAWTFPGPLNLGASYPDIVVNQVTIDYTPATGKLKILETASSSASYLATEDGQGKRILFPNMKLRANLDTAADGALLGGRFWMDGRIPSLGITQDTRLIDGKLAAYGITGEAGAGVLEFVLAVTESDPALGFGEMANIVLPTFDLAPADIQVERAFTGTGNLDVGARQAPAIPEPGRVGLLALGLGLLGGVAWRRHTEC